MSLNEKLYVMFIIMETKQMINLLQYVLTNIKLNIDETRKLSFMNTVYTSIKNSRMSYFNANLLPGNENIPTINFDIVYAYGILLINTLNTFLFNDLQLYNYVDSIDIFDRISNELDRLELEFQNTGHTRNLEIFITSTENILHMSDEEFERDIERNKVFINTYFYVQYINHTRSGNITRLNSQLGSNLVQNISKTVYAPLSKIPETWHESILNILQNNSTNEFNQNTVNIVCAQYNIPLPN